MRELVPNPTFNRQRLCMTVLLVIIGIATFIAVLSYLAGDRQVRTVVYRRDVLNICRLCEFVDKGEGDHLLFPGTNYNDI